jgi:hypothetical protein
MVLAALAVLGLAVLGLWTNAIVRWALPPGLPPAAPATPVPELTGPPFVAPTPSGVRPSR